MKLTVFLDHKFTKCPDGSVWSMIMFGPDFWEQYLQTFSSIEVVSRLRPQKTPPSNGRRVDSERISFRAMPFYEGPYQYLKVMNRVKASIRDAVSDAEAVILRIPQNFPFEAGRLLMEKNKPYGVEVVADPWDQLSKGCTKNLFRPYFQRKWTRLTRSLAKNAAACSYVTEAALQERYPPDPNAFSQGVSDVEIDEFAEEHRSVDSFRSKKIRFINVGSMNQLYKGQDVLIKAFSGLIKKRGFQAELFFVGDGKFRNKLEAQSHSLGVQGHVNFLGAIQSGNKVFEQLDQADIFVMPSRQEGLPRAMVEAMSRGLPCIGSDVGGIGELIPSDCLIPAGDVAALLSKMETFGKHPEILSSLSLKALERSRSFQKDMLSEQKLEFLKYVCDSSG